MARGPWWATVHGFAESGTTDTTERMHCSAVLGRQRRAQQGLEEPCQCRLCDALCQWLQSMSAPWAPLPLQSLECSLHVVVSNW